MGKVYLDQKGFENYQKEIEKIRAQIQKNAQDMSEFASDDAYGDTWHDNFAYEEAMKKENALFYELQQKLEGLSNIEIIETNTNENQVDIGDVIEIIFDGEEESEKYQLTGDSTSSLHEELPMITLNSPLGKALYQKQIGDTFSYEVDEHILKGTIIHIEKD